MSKESQGIETPNSFEHRDDVGARLGMWLFLFSELMLFGALFLTYAVYRSIYQADFHSASQELNLAMGSFNTFILLTSSLSMVLCVVSLQRQDKGFALSMLWATIVLGGVFLLNKYFEWHEDYQQGLFPGLERMEKLPHGQQLFFSLYFVMTGLHGLHLIAGILLLGFMLIKLKQGKITPFRCVALDNAGLYWHLVDVIWIFLLPLFYIVA